MAGRVVVTGISSFVGFHLARAFAGSGWEVVATHSRPLDSYVGIQRLRLGRVAPVARTEALDLRDAGAVAALVARERPSLWVHHGGHAVAYASPDYDLTESLAVNLAPLAGLYRALADAGCGGVLVTGSSAEYSAAESANCEDDACWPDTPYGLSKLAETLAARQHCLRFGVPTRVARLYIPFGPLDNPAKLLAQAVEALAAGRKLDLSPCLQRRDFIGVEDVARGTLALAGDCGRGGFDLFNLCSGTATPLRDLLLGLARRMGADPGLLRFGAIPMRPGEPATSYGANAKACDRLGWVPNSLDRSLDGLLP